MVSILCKSEVIDSSKYQLYKTPAIFCRHKSHRRMSEDLLLSSGHYNCTRGYWHLKSTPFNVEDFYPDAPNNCYAHVHRNLYPDKKKNSLSELRDDCAAEKIDEAFLRQTCESKNWLIYHLTVVEFMKRASLQYLPVHCVVVGHFLKAAKYSVLPQVNCSPCHCSQLEKFNWSP